MQHIYGFNALRAVSVTLVILSHLGIIEASTGFAQQFFSVFNAAFGVKTFFILSGFLIHTLLIREFERNGSIDIRSFIVRRAFRILPLYYLALAFVATLAGLGLAEKANNGITLALLMVYNFVRHGANVNYLSHFWSIAVEEQFYLFAPVLFAYLYPKRGVMFLLGSALLAVCAIVLHVGFGDLSKSFGTNRWTFPAIYPILMGSMMAVALHDKGLASRLRSVIASPIALTFSVLLIVRPLFLDIEALTFGIIDAFGVAGLVGWIYLNQKSAIVRKLDWGPVGYIGVISYGLYVWQGIFTGNGPYRSFVGWPPNPYHGIIITLVVAPITYHFFELPVKRLRESLIARRSSAS